MWFKNLRVYRLNQPFDRTAESLDAELAEHAFTPCGGQDMMRYGFVPPLGRHGHQFVHTANGYIMVCVKHQEKVLPAAVVQEQLEEQILAISQDEARDVNRSERSKMKDEIIFTLLPKALTKSRLQYAYFAPDEQLLVVDASSASRAEDLLAALRDALGSLSVVPLTTLNKPTQTMTQWLLQSEVPGDFELGDECELEAPKDDGRVIRCKKQDLTAEEIINHLNTDMVVSKLALNWKDAITCVVDHELGIKRLKFTDKITDQVNDRHPDSAAEEFDLDFSIMTLELKAFLQALQEAFGGLKELPPALDE